jgi:thiol-disulfide isomerase/thioredoxin
MPPPVLRRVVVVALAAMLAATVLPSDGMARPKNDPVPSTGLKTIGYAQVPPDFDYDVGGGPTRLSAQFGQPVVINFWATWCHPCQDELGVFTRLQKEYAGRATLVTLSSEDSGVARAYLKQQGIALPVAEDPSHHVFDAYSIGPIPVTLILRPDGTVEHVSVGELDWTELHDAVDAALRVTAPGS